MIPPSSRPRQLLTACLAAMAMEVSTIPSSVAAPSPPESPPDAARIDSWQQTILARPLFSPTRRPAEIPGTGNARPRLTGIVVSSGRRRAIFMIPGQDRGRIADVGDLVGPWQIIAIENGTIRVRDMTGEHAMRPDRDRRTDTRAGGTATESVPPNPEEQ